MDLRLEVTPTSRFQLRGDDTHTSLFARLSPLCLLFFLFALLFHAYSRSIYIKNPNPLFASPNPRHEINLRASVCMLAMDCLGQRSLSVSLQAWRFRKRRAWSHREQRVVVERKKRSLGAVPVRTGHGSVPVRATTSGEVVRTEEGFADEEDYRKGGGSEILYVKMQEMKQMERQSKLADKVTNSFINQLVWVIGELDIHNSK